MAVESQQEQQKPRGSSTICLPFDKELYEETIDSPEVFRRWLDDSFDKMPELFPEGFAQGYLLKDDRVSAKLGIRLRRIECKATAEVFTVRPSFVMPYMTAFTDDVAHPLFLRRFGVPFWGLTHVFGKYPMYWYRLEMSLARNSIVGTTVRRVDIPEHLLADEHHQTLDGEKVYIATVVAEGCCLGASVVDTADEVGLTAAYQTFQVEASNVEPAYAPKTVNTDGWKATKLAWLALFPAIVVLRCFLHGWLKIRDRCKKHADFHAAGDKIWHAYEASNLRVFAQRLRRLREWARQKLTGIIQEKVLKLCSRSKEYGVAYEHPQGHRTSNMLDRVMKPMNRYFDGCQHLHGSHDAAEKHSRAWALLFNFTPWSPAAVKANDGWQSPAERLNQHRYHSDWLQNLLVSASLAGFRRPLASPQNAG
jgi:hypothetical protein